MIRGKLIALLVVVLYIRLPRYLSQVNKIIKRVVQPKCATHMSFVVST